MVRTCSSLQKGEQVVFRTTNSIRRCKTCYDGNVIYVDNETKTVAVCYLEGYRSEVADVDFEDMIAVYNPEAPIMKFENISGRSDLLVAE